MSSKVLFPSLSEDGWVNTPLKVADLLFSHFILADKSQTYMYDDMVASFPWIIQNTQKDITQTIIQTQETLRSYFIRYFNDVVVEVSEVPNVLEPSKGQISIYLRFTDTEGTDHVLGKLLTIIESKVAEIIDISNG